MFNIINPELVVFDYDKLEDGDVFKYTPPFEYGSVHVYTIFKMGTHMYMTVTKLKSDYCETESYPIKKGQKYYLDRYGRIQSFCKNSIQGYLVGQKRLPPDTIEMITLEQLKERLSQHRATPLISKLNDEIKEYNKWEQVSTILKGELEKNLQGGDELLLKYDGGYGNYSYAILVIEEEEEESIFE